MPTVGMPRQAGTFSELGLRGWLGPGVGSAGRAQQPGAQPVCQAHTLSSLTARLLSARGAGERGRAREGEETTPNPALRDEKEDVVGPHSGAFGSVF